MVIDNMPLRKTAEEINAEPEWLNGKVLRGGALGHIILTDRTIHGMTLDAVEIESLTAHNVIFIDCHFVATRVKNATLDNVKFQGGSFQSRGNYDDFEKRTKFYGSDKFNVIFDKVSFYQPSFEGIQSGNIMLRDIKNYKIATESHNLILGANMNIRIDNCEFEKSNIVVGYENCNIYATNTIINDGSFSSVCKSLYIDKCIIDGSLGYAERGVVKDSTVLVDICGKSIYFMNCTFLQKKETN